VSDDLDLLGLLAKIGKDYAVEYVPLEKRTSPTNLKALVVKRIRIDLVHGFAVLLISRSDRAFAVDI
jgi:hypothetical protein